MLLVSDPRPISNFKSETFSHHRRNDVLRSLTQSVHLGQIDYALHWAFELLLSGLVDTLWMHLFEIAATQAHRANPTVFAYLRKRFYEDWMSLRSAHVADILRIRNSGAARTLVAEATAILTMSPKARLVAFPPVKPTDYEEDAIVRAARAPATDYARAVWRPREDPPGLFIAANEIAFALREDTRDPVAALYWIRWALGFDSKTVCAARGPADVPPRHRGHPAWLVWALIQEESSRRPTNVQNAIGALFSLYRYCWTPSQHKNFFATAVSFLLEPVDFTVPLVATPAFLKTINPDAIVAEFSDVLVAATK